MRRITLRQALACAALSSTLLLQACLGGGSSTEDSEALTDTPVGDVWVLATEGKPSALSAAQTNTIQVSGSTAQVTLPANALVNLETGKAVTGSVDVTLSVLTPATNPHGMAAGIYEARSVTGSDIELIESFGAISVQLEQNGQRLQLAKGQTATIRIPLNTRSSERPASIPLYYWDDQQALWIQEGGAQLRGNAETGYYYEGTVSHFTVWNADRPIEESVTITGCVRDPQGQPVPADQFSVVSNGMDYSGMDWAVKVGVGQFSVMAKKGGQVELALRSDSGQVLKTALGPLNQDTTMPSCMTLGEAPKQLPAPSNFERLFLQLLQGMSAGLSPLGALDPTTELPTMLAPSNICQSGSVNGLTLNGRAVAGGEALRLNTTESISLGYAACAPSTLDMTALTNPQEALQAFTGQARLDLLIQEATSTQFSATARTTLVSMVAADSQLSSNGLFVYTLHDASDASDDPDANFSSRFQVNPAQGASISNLRSQRTAVFKSGGFTHTNSPTQMEMRFNALRYTIGNDEYILDGVVGAAQGTRLTLQKNGAVSAVVRGVTSAGWDVVGEVDPI